VVLPEIDLPCQLFALQPAALPQRVIGVLNLQRRQRINLASAERRVQRRHFAHQNVQRPAIADDVVLRHQ
jgi:hypothetical protein